MNFKNKKILASIKILSIVLISGAIGLELLNVYALQINAELPSSLRPCFWLGRFAITIHLAEGIVAAFYAPAKVKKPIEYGTYTFFVGTVGLLELFEK